MEFRLFFSKIKKYIKRADARFLILFIILGVFIGLFYFSFLPVISPDSTWYYNLSNIIKGSVPFDQWWQIRGPVLPATIGLITLIFGDNPIGFLIGTFVFYMLMILFILMITRQVVKLFDNKVSKIITYLLVFILIFINPVIIGYYHAMLTEFIATTLGVLCCWLSYKWINADFREGVRIKYTLFVLFFGITIGLMWLLKQPYATVAALPFLIASIISMINNIKITNLLSKIVAIVVCFVIASLTINSWDSFMCSRVSCKESAGASGYLSGGLINGVSSIKKIQAGEVGGILNNESSKSKFLDTEERNAILDIDRQASRYKSYSIYDINGSGNKTIDLMVAVSSSEGSKLSTSESALFIANVFSKHPYIVVKSYVKNYLAAADVIGVYVDDKNYYPVAADYFKNNGENLSLSYAAFAERPIYWWPVGDRPATSDPLVDYEVINKPNSIASYLFSVEKSFGLLLFSIMFLMLPLVFFYCLIKFFTDRFSKKSQKRDNINEMLLILFGFCFFNAVAHSLIGASIDRYLSVGYPVALLGMILLIGSMLRIKTPNKIIKKEKLEGLLFVIPAHNEELNIGAVIKDINEKIPEADILVINDCSSDGTREVVESMGVKCITMPFNVRYAMAVQTGIKYAQDNNYGYVIQFDADGQHLAKEAKKLFVEMKKTNCDIVIGSRFLKKTGYKHSRARMLGTKMFSSIIKIFTGKNIADPTSGLQCLNRSVIEKYSRMGEYPEYPDANLIIYMLFKGYDIREVSAEMKQRENGESMHSGILKPAKYMIKITYAIFVIIINSIKFAGGSK